MVKKTVDKETKILLQTLISAMQEKKAKNLISIDISGIENSVTNYFVICSGTSTTQVDSIYDNILKCVSEELEVKPFHREGYENSEWILIDYFDIVVHIFLEDIRNFYKLEDLWADGVIKIYEDVA
ncbi:MAG: ribosome silencing factor [Chlorobi bacterium]|nr:ribosome silencing factor [Chlorobiota bacterium]